jgi:hypothetical protein
VFFEALPHSTTGGTILFLPRVALLTGATKGVLATKLAVRGLKLTTVLEFATRGSLVIATCGASFTGFRTTGFAGRSASLPDMPLLTLPVSQN